MADDRVVLEVVIQDSGSPASPGEARDARSATSPRANRQEAASPRRGRSTETQRDVVEEFRRGRRERLDAIKARLSKEEGSSAASTATASTAGRAARASTTTAAATSGGSRAAATASTAGVAAIGPAAVVAAAALATVALAARAASTALKDIEKAQQFSGRVAGAVAAADVREIQGDIRRARNVEGQLSDFVRSQSRFNEARRDLETNIQETFLPLATDIGNHLATLINLGNKVIDIQQGLDKLPDSFAANFKEKFGLDLAMLNPSVAGINKSFIQLLDWLLKREAAKEDEEDAFAELEAFLDPVRTRLKWAAGELFNDGGPRR